MRKWLTKHPWIGLGAGFALGLLVGAGMLIGSWTTIAFQASQEFTFPELGLHATATDSGETFAMATGEVTDGMEGVVFLDFLTGEIQCWVMNGRTGQVGGYFAHNIIADLGIEPGRKNPKYLLVTGQAPMQRGSSGIRPADSLIYVADANTGKFAVYALPLNRGATAANMPQKAPMACVFKGAARSIEIRGQ